MLFDVKITIRKLGRACATCKQDLVGQFEADSAEGAVKAAKDSVSVDWDTHQALINYVRKAQ